MPFIWKKEQPPPRWVLWETGDGKETFAPEEGATISYDYAGRLFCSMSSSAVDLWPERDALYRMCLDKMKQLPRTLEEYLKEK